MMGGREEKREVLRQELREIEERRKRRRSEVARLRSEVAQEDDDARERIAEIQAELRALRGPRPFPEVFLQVAQARLGPDVFAVIEREAQRVADEEEDRGSAD